MNSELFDQIIAKSKLEQTVKQHTTNAFKLLKEATSKISDDFGEHARKQNFNNLMEYQNMHSMAIELTFGVNVLRFVMHSNVFLIPRYDPINQTSYLKDDEERGFCGVINIYNFLSDSFKYKRYDDIGYMIGRLFVNKENHYFVQGKQELSRFLNRFSDAPLDKDTVFDLVRSAMMYTLHFDLLIPPYDTVKEVSVLKFQTDMENMNLIPTGKRLGFRFAADSDNAGML